MNMERTPASELLEILQKSGMEISVLDTISTLDERSALKVRCSLLNLSKCIAIQSYHMNFCSILLLFNNITQERGS